MVNMRAFVMCVGLLLPAGCAHTVDADLLQLPEFHGSHGGGAEAEPVVYVSPSGEELDGAHSMAFYIDLALRRNPQIQASERRVAAQALIVPQVTALPDPMLSNTFWPVVNNSPQTASGRMPYSLMLSQQFPWFGKLRLKGEIADRETQIAMTQLVSASLDVVESVKHSYYEIYFNQRAIEINKKNEQLLKEYYIKQAEAQYRTGARTQQDVLRAQVELDKVRDQLIGLERGLKQAQADLAKQLAVSPDSDLQVQKTLDLPSAPKQNEDLYQAAIAFRPELQEQLEMTLRDQKSLELAKLNYYPDVTIGVGWDLMTRSDAISPVADGFDNVGFNVSFNLPVWRRKLQASVAEAENRTLESTRRYESIRDETMRLIRRLTVQAQTLEVQIQLYKKNLIPRAEQTFKVSSDAYAVGKIDALQVIDNWRQLLEFQLQLVRLEATLGQTQASLERAVGLELIALPDGRLAPNVPHSSPNVPCSSTSSTPAPATTSPLPTKSTPYHGR